MKTVSRRRGDAKLYALGAVGFVFALGLFFTLVVRYSLAMAPQLNREAMPVVETFYTCAQRHDFAGARETFGPGLKDNISTEDLAKRWRKFEKQHGPLASWKLAAGQAGAVNLFPKSVDFDHLVLGKQGHGTRIFIRVVPVGNAWRIEKLSLFS